MLVAVTSEQHEKNAVHEEEVTIVQVGDAAIDHIEEVDDEGEVQLAEVIH